MTIRIINLRNYRPVAGEVLIKVDRSSPVGNPFPMRSESQRDEVCDKYEAYFKDKITAKKDQRFMGYLRMIYQSALHNNVALGCWCAPKRCHAEAIKHFLDEYMRGDK